MTPTPDAPPAPSTEKPAPAAPPTSAPTAQPPAPAATDPAAKSPASGGPAAPAPPAAKSPTPAPAVQKSPVPAPSAPAAPASTPSVAAAAPKQTASVKPAAAAPAAALRFALEFGPFAASVDAERIERQLTQAGYQTVRFRQQTGAALYAVLLERIPGATEAQALLGTLREQGYGEAVLVRPDPPVVRVGEPLPLRRAVELAERLRAGGYQVRVAAQPGEGAAFTVRHGSFPSRSEAGARAEELGRLGVTAQVVQVR